MKSLWTALVVALAMTANGFAQIPLPEVPESQKQELVGYLTENWMSPEDYVVSKFSDRDIVFVGEFHKVKHDLQLIQDLIPRLYAAGIYNLGIEFGDHEYQDTVDYLLTAPTYDEELARWLMFKRHSLWGFVEYEDIYRKAWELNHSLPTDAPPFRIVGLNYRPRWDLLSDNMSDSLWKRVWFKGNSDEHMARVILDEFVKKNQKALVYSGIHHAFTRYHQPEWDDKTATFYGFMTGRMGNIVHDSIPDRVFTIGLHYPWYPKHNWDAGLPPVGGMIDALIQEFPDKRVGFDVVGTPFGDLIDTVAVYSVGHDHFALKDWCDGYVYQGPFNEYEGCTVDTSFVTNANFEEACAFTPNGRARRVYSKPEECIDTIRYDADIRSRIADRIAAAKVSKSVIVPLPVVPDPQKQELIGYLTENWMSPEDYVVSKFADRDVVFLLGWPWVRHDIELVKSLVPLLYKAGVYNLGMPYASYDLQGRADSLVNAAVYDEDLARSLVFGQSTYWAFSEYLDVYKAAWELNRSLPATAPRFRVVNLGYRPRWDLATADMTSADSQRVWYQGTEGEFMARVVLKEFVQRDLKALICPTIRNAFTRFRLPQTDPKTRSFAGYFGKGMGNIVSDSIPARVFSINLHWAWMQKDNQGQSSHPVDGVIDAVMCDFDAPRVGFDVGGSPFATLVDSTSGFSVGYSPFVLADFCDGYVYQKPLSSYEGCTVDTLFITSENFNEAVRYFPNVAIRQSFRRPSDILDIARQDAQILKRWVRLR